MKKYVEQEVVNRASRIYDDGEMGFHDYVTKWEEFNTFVCRVSSIAEDCMEKGELIGISYPTENIAIISYVVTR